jgi:hypothetical protein
LTRPTTLTAYRWELRKLGSQKRTYIGLGAAALLPVTFVVVMAFQKGGPYDVPLGHNLRRTGVPLALVVITFASRFGALVYALVQEALGALVHLDLFRHYLLSDQFDGWHGLFQTPTDWTPVTRAVWVSAVFVAVPLAAAFVVFRRRDVAGE